MQLTIDIPDRLAAELTPARQDVAAILARGLRRSWSAGSALRGEVISFLARRPTTDAILGFRPSEAAQARSRELLDRNRAGTLTPEEEAELDEMCELDSFVSLIKAEVLRENPGHA